MSAWAKTENCPIREDQTAEIAQQLLDTGLLYWVNAAVLHNFGVGLGVSVAEDGKTVDGLALNLTDDPNGVWFDEDTTEGVRERMRATGLAKNVTI